MKASDLPTRFPIPFAAAAGPSYIRDIPEASQIGITPGAASLETGFVPLNFTPRNAGGVPPFGQDWNGLMKQVTQWSRWQAASAPVPFDNGFAADIGGYPQGAVLQSLVYPGLSWRSTVDDNTTDPDSNAASGWAVNTPMVLTANTTFYVAIGGSDANNTGLTVGSPWATMQKAADFLKKMVNFNGFQVTISLGTGSFAGANFNWLCQGQVSAILITGNGAANTTVTSTINATGSLIQVAQMAFTSALNCITSGAGAIVTLGAGLSFGSIGANGAHLYGNTGRIVVSANYAITAGGGAAHYQFFNDASLEIAGGITITLTGTPAFSLGFAYASGCANIALGQTNAVYSGAASCPRYLLSFNSTCNVNSAGASVFPGSSPGSANTGGQYQ